MTSPFSTSSTVLFTLEPVLNPLKKTYMQIITLNDIPDGPLAELVTPIHVPQLSPFQQPNFIPPHTCIYALLRYPKDQRKYSFKDSQSFMYADDMPSVFSYLVDNGYTIQENLTDLMFKSKINVGGVSQSRLSGNRRTICFASYSST